MHFVIILIILLVALLAYFIFRRKSKPSLRCPWCGYEGVFRNRRFDGNTGGIFIILLFFGIVPAFIFAWHINSQIECPNCKAIVPPEKVRESL